MPRHRSLCCRKKQDHLQSKTALLSITTGQVATDALVAMERAMARDKIPVNDRQLACARIGSEEGQNYLKVGPKSYMTH